MQETATPAIDYEAGNKVVWNTTLLTPEALGNFVREYGEGPFRVKEVGPRSGRLMAQIVVHGGNALRFEAVCLKKAPEADVGTRH